MEYIVEFEGERMQYGNVVLDSSAGGGICRGVTAVVGKNGSGKTTLGNIIAKGRYGYGNRLSYSEDCTRIKMLAFTDIHSFTGIDVQYYQQRMEATSNDYVLTVGEIFGKKLQMAEWVIYADLFRLRDIENKKINYLSSGELRKLLIINALCERPDLLILDNPYIGLDAASREDFDAALKAMRSEGLSVLMLLCDPGDVPEYADSVIGMSRCRIMGSASTEILDENLTQRSRGLAEVKFSVFSLKSSESSVSDACRRDGKVAEDSLAIARGPIPSDDLNFARDKHKDVEVVFGIRDGHARYGDKVIFEGFDWTVRRGECWQLKGPNGSGKSLLLSMICADNPQGYSNDITLFDRRRGTGESIWEIKDAIGYVCPEMQLYYKSNDSVREIIVQGMRNALNRYRKSTPEELEIADGWMRALEIAHLGDRRFSELSSGEQRMVMLARAFAKQPELLVLDEPLHGLDAHHKEIVKDVICRMVGENGATLIYVSHYDSEVPECVTNVKEIGSGS